MHLRSDAGQLVGMRGRERILSTDGRLIDTNQTGREGAIIIFRRPQVRDHLKVLYLTAADNSDRSKTG